MTPAALHAAFAPLVARDPGFIPGELAYDPERKLWGFRRENPEKWHELDDEFVWKWVYESEAAALIRDRIETRLVELGWSVLVSRAGPDWYVACSRDGGLVYPERGPDPTLTRIAAAMKATEPGKQRGGT